MLSVNGLLLQVDKKNVGRIVSRIQMAVTTKVNEVDVKTTCRVCLLKQEPANLFYLFGSNKMFEDLSIATAIMECFGVDLKQDKELPNYVCIKCASSTLQSYTFKKCLKKCQGYLEKLRKVATVKKEQILSENKENPVQGSHGILHNYSSQQTIVELEQENNNEINDDSTNICSVDHSYNIPAYSKNNQNIDPSVLLATSDHNYSKEMIIKEDGVQYVTEDTFENKDVAEDTKNVHELEQVNKDSMIKGHTQEILNYAKRQKKSQEIKSNNVNIKTTSESERWWSKEAGPPYECKICGRAYGVKFRAFYMHARMHRIQKLSCVHCSKRFTRDKMIIHMRTHTKEKPYVCNQCSARFTIEGNLKRHLRCHTGEKLYVCDICGKAFTQSTSLRNHKQAHAGKTLFVCVYCGKTFSSDSSHRSHLHQHHKIRSADLNNENSVEEQGDHVEKYTCSTCNKVFRKAVALHVHARVHIECKKYHCDLCLKRFSSHFNYQIHMLWHELQMQDSSQTQNRDWSCEFCSQVFNEKNVLVTHILTHMERPFLCTICDKSFITKVALLHHSRQHTDDKPFSCSLCGKKFRYAATLKQHFRVHTGEKPHKCEVCSRYFAQQQQLISHMLTHTGEKKHVCPYCGKAFALNGNLTVHKRRHTGETPYVCDVCKRGFYDSSSLKKHKQGQHNNIFKNLDVDELLKKENVEEYDILNI